jgi:hypothetical protein
MAKNTQAVTRLAIDFTGEFILKFTKRRRLRAALQNKQDAEALLVLRACSIAFGVQNVGLGFLGVTVSVFPFLKMSELSTCSQRGS